MPIYALSPLLQVLLFVVVLRGLLGFLLQGYADRARSLPGVSSRIHGGIGGGVDAAASRSVPLSARRKNSKSMVPMGAPLMSLMVWPSSGSLLAREARIELGWPRLCLSLLDQLLHGIQLGKTLRFRQEPVRTMGESSLNINS